MIADRPQYVGEPKLRVDVVELGGGNQPYIAAQLLHKPFGTQWCSGVGVVARCDES